MSHKQAAMSHNTQAAMAQAEARKTSPLPITAAHVEGQVSLSF